ncbi:ROK family transcriptional regulator [Haloechinothrix salitolerans]|uniref:ROK family transcriptional regulator n=1 Tax=Haloechinothrix salitolerans TaxID=926830 RepID=A0ABW2C1P4_9PSEU
MSRRPGTPQLLRELNDRAALELLLDAGPLTRAQIGERTGLSKVTASQLLSRLQERGLIGLVGEQAGGRGPNAALYGVLPSSAYVAGLDVGPNSVTVGITDITGSQATEVTVDPNGQAEPVRVVHDALARACASAGVAETQLNAVVVGTPGVLDPCTGDMRFAFDLPHWHEGVLDGLRNDLRRPVLIENDVNLVAIAEREYGAARDVDDFCLIWIDRGVGMAIMLGRRLYRGRSGGAGEIGYLPVPGVPLPDSVRESQSWGKPALAGGFGSLVGADAVVELAREHGIGAPSAVECVTAAVSDVDAQAGFLDELATRISLGVASVGIVLDPELLVIAGQLGRAGGSQLATRVNRAVGRICPVTPHIAVTEVDGNPVLRGAIYAALERAREELLDSTTAT